jgi:hypothetical protein
MQAHEPMESAGAHAALRNQARAGAAAARVPLC